MKNQWVLASALAMLVTACGAKEWNGEQVVRDVVNYMDEKIRGRPYEPARGKQPELIVTHEGLLFEGRMLRLGAPLEDWLAVLGSPDLMSKEGDVMNWEGLGLRLVSSTTLYGTMPPLNDDKPFVGQIVVFVQPRRWSPGKYDIAFPKGTFPGYLQFDGFGIDARTTEQDIMRLNRRSERPYRYHCIGGEVHTCEGTRKLSSRITSLGMREYLLFQVNFSFNEQGGDTVESVAFGIEGYERISELPEIDEF